MASLEGSRLHARSKEMRRVARFGMVGLVATVVHWLVTVSVTELLQLNPLVANTVGWGIAVAVSFAGHWSVTFGDHGGPLIRSGLRFLGVSALGFVANSILFGALLSINPSLYAFWLSLTLALVAVMTYLLSNLWAFRSD
ncbi:GtrA family protein [Aquabacterium soli]|jgi:putative flippase GtrA|nr:GtrA family protein [Aquabacterium soli]